MRIKWGKKAENLPNKKRKSFQDNIVFIDKKWISYINITDGATFTLILIKHSKIIINQKIDFPSDAKKLIHTITNKQWLEHTYFPYIE